MNPLSIYLSTPTCQLPSVAIGLPKVMPNIISWLSIRFQFYPKALNENSA